MGLVLFAIHVLPHGAAPALGVPAALYVGPDQILPLTSVLGAIAGVLLMFWHRVAGTLRRIRTYLSRR